MERKAEILSFFTIPDSVVSLSLLNSVIEKSYRIALKYLHFNRMRISKLVIKEEITIQELAIDCIAELFVKENNVELLLIQQAFQNWKPAIISEEDSLYFLNKLVASRVEQHLSKMLKEGDPFFSKLLDSVTYLIRTSGFYKIHFLGKTFITENNLENFEKCFISTDEFEKLPAALFKNKKTLLIDLFNFLKNETEFNPAIPLNDLVNKLKQFNFSDYLINDNDDSAFKKIEIDEIVENGLNTAMGKLIISYIGKGKLSAQEKKAFESALKGMAEDLGDGGINPGLYHYLLPHLTGLSEAEYKTKYHNILEYLFKVMKIKIADKLMEKN